MTSTETELRSATAREILAKLHPAIKDDWREKLLRIEKEAIDEYIEEDGVAGNVYGVDDDGPE